MQKLKLDSRWLRQAVQLALKTCPSTLWEPEPCIDYSGQRLRVECVREQGREMILAARAKTVLAPYQWATTGKWPRLGKASSYFLREALHTWQLKDERVARWSEPPEGPFAKPPWTTEQAVWLTDATVLAWYCEIAPAWLDVWAEHEAARLDNVADSY